MIIDALHIFNKQLFFPVPLTHNREDAKRYE
jgi:hypothetical protein